MPTAESQGAPPQFYDLMLQRMDSLTTNFSEFQTEMMAGFQSFGTQFSAFDSRLSRVEDAQAQHANMLTRMAIRQRQHGHGLQYIQDSLNPPVFRRGRGGRPVFNASPPPPPPSSQS